MLSKGQNRCDMMEMVWLEDLVPQEHLLRKIDAAVDFNRIYEMVKNCTVKIPEDQVSTLWF